MLLHYNRDLVRGANLVDPIELESKDEWTWETFKQYCRVLTTDEESEDKIVGGSMPLGYTPVSVMFLEGWGGKYYDTANKKVLEVRTANGARKDLGRPTLTARQNVESFRQFLKK